ncbi:MAG: galactokinase [Bacteroidetes bacterium]|nr:galactokinase [Bacteroidota bacterium]
MKVAMEEDIRKELFKLYRLEFGKSPEVIASAPGRINLIGEHTDYNEGFVLPIAIDRRTYTAAGKRGGKLFIAYSKELGKKTSFEMFPGRFEHSNFWVNYIKGACSLLNDVKSVEGTNFAIGSTVPRGSGLSSSAAYVVSIIEAVSYLYDIRLKNIEVPMLAQRIENEFVGVQSGIMDPFVAKFAQTENAILVDTRSLDYEYVPVPPDCSILVCVTGIKRALATTEYNKRRQQCQQAVDALSERLDRKLNSLRDVTVDELKNVEGEIEQVLYMRALHILTENDRALKAAAALKKDDRELVGKLMLESHMSLRTNYEVSSPELDAFVEIGEQLDGVYGARMTGAGFGGSAICLVDADDEESLATEIDRRYKERGYENGSVFIARSGSGSVLERL